MATRTRDRGGSRTERAHRQAIQRARDALARDIVVFDTETTGLGMRDEIIEISCVSGRGEVLLDSFVEPRIPVPGEATAINGIRGEDLADAPTMAVLMDRLEPILSGAEVIASYNLDFDGRLLVQSARKGYRLPRSAGFLCIMRAYAAWRGEWNDDFDDFRWHRLADAMAESGGRDRGTPHGSLQNALGALGVLRHIARDGEAQEDDPGDGARAMLKGWREISPEWLGGFCPWPNYPTPPAGG